MEFIKLGTRLDFNKYIGVQDTADKIGSDVTIGLFTFFSILIIYKQYFLNSMSCYVSSGQGGLNIKNFIDSYCWVHGMIQINSTTLIPQTDEEWANMEHYRYRYYQWLPFIINIMALSFIIPNHVLRLFFGKYEMADNVIKLVAKRDFKKAASITKNTFLNKVKSSTFSQKYTLIMERHVGMRIFDPSLCRDNSKSDQQFGLKKTVCRCRCSKIWSYMNSLQVQFFLYKFVSLGQISLLIYWIEIFFNDNSIHNYGFRVIKHINEGKDFEASMVFPKIGYCHLKLQLLGSINSITAQCSLPSNMLIEKIFVFIWFWLVFILTLQLMSIIIWNKSSLFTNRIKFLRSTLQLKPTSLNATIELRIKEWVINKYYLNYETILLMKLIKINSSPFHLQEMMKILFKDLTLCLKPTYFDREYNELNADSKCQRIEITDINNMRVMNTPMPNVSTLNGPFY